MSSGDGCVAWKWALKIFTVDFSRKKHVIVDSDLYRSPVNGGSGLCLQSKMWHFVSAFHNAKGVLFDNLVPNSPFCSAVEMMEAAQWVGISWWAQKSRRTKIQVCDIDSVDRSFDVEKETLCLLFKDLN